MNAFFEQLGLDSSFFVEFAIIAVIFFALSNLYFRPFLKLFEARHKKTVQDREAAERLLAQANIKWEEYNRLLNEERLAAKKGFQKELEEVKKQEAELLAQARNEAKKTVQEATESIHQQRLVIKKQLEHDVESIAQSVSERFLSRKV